MCRRYSISPTAAELAERFDIDVPEAYRSRYNAAPTQILPVITDDNPEGLSFFYWGVVPKFAKNKSLSPKLYNTKAETFIQKATASKALRQRRCLVPADGFYDWKNVSKKGVVPYRFVLEGQKTFAFAGVWEEYEDDEEGMVYTFSIITTEANAITRDMGLSMPAIIAREDEKKWLNNDLSVDECTKLLKPFPAQMMNSFTVSSLLNNLENDKPELLRPAPAADQFGNYTLFS